VTRLSVGDSKLEVELSTTFDAGWGGYPAFTSSPTSSTRVYITMPDGTREGFTFTPYQTAIDSFGLFTDWLPAFTPDPGINDTLTVPDAVLTQDQTNGGFYIITDAGSIDYYNPAAPTFGGTYMATDLSGTGSTIDANSGKLLSMKGRNNNTLTFSSGAITSNTGKTITISRDPQGRIPGRQPEPLASGNVPVNGPKAHRSAESRRNRIRKFHPDFSLWFGWVFLPYGGETWVPFSVASNWAVCCVIIIGRRPSF
jgi:hypothetical protein